jgi:MFS family permease
MVGLTFVVGPIADRLDRGKIILLAQLLEAVVLILLCGAIWIGEVSTPAIFVCVAAIGAARAFEHPTFSALLPAVVPPSSLHRAVALSTSSMQTATIVGPSLGALLYGIGAVLPLGLAALLFVSAASSMALIKIERATLAREPVTPGSVFSGVSFIWGRSTVLGVISLDLFAVLLGGVTALLPIYARDILHAGPWGLGLLRSAPAIGAVITSVLLSRTSLGTHVGLKMFTAVIAFGAATVAFSLSANLAFSIGALLVVGASDTISVVIRMSMIQLFTPDTMRGRVSAVNSLFIGTSNQLGEFESGMVAGLLGPVAAGVTGGLGTIVVALIWMWRFPGLRKLSTLAEQNA